MREQPSDLAIEHADQLASSGDRDAKQLFGRQAERMFLVHRRDIVEPVEVGQRLQVGFMLDQLFGAAMEQADMGIDAPDHLTVEFQDEAQHPVCRRVLRSKIDREIAERSFGHVGLFRFGATETPGTFSCSANAPISDAFVPRPGTFIRALIWLRRGEKWRLRVRASNAELGRRHTWQRATHEPTGHPGHDHASVNWNDPSVYRSDCWP